MRALNRKLRGLTLSHRHIQTNIKPGDSRADRDRIRRAVQQMYARNPDTATINEANSHTHRALKAQGKRLGYGVYIPQGAASQVVLIWKKSRFACILRKAVQAGDGRRNVTPNRYVVRVRLRDRLTTALGVVIGTHAISSGWTGPKLLDVFRRGHWAKHVDVLRRIQRAAYRFNDWVIGAGDLNRPWDQAAWISDLLPRATYKAAESAQVVKTKATHGSARFDYVWVISRWLKATTKGVVYDQPSDHRAVVADIAFTLAA